MLRFYVVVLVGLSLVSCGKEATGLTGQDRTALDNLRSDLENAIMAGDAAAYAALCTDDVRLLHAGSPIITGKSDLQSHNAEMFESVDVVSLTLTPVEIYGVEDLAYEVGTQKLVIEPEFPNFAGSRKYVHVFRRGNDGEWCFAALMSSDN